MSLTPDHLIEYAKELSWGEFGQRKEIYVSGDILLLEKPTGSNLLGGYKALEVCWYVVYILWVWLTDYPWDSWVDISKPKVINSKTVATFRARTKYLLKTP